MTINVTAVGATPTATVALQGSPSTGSDAAWVNLAAPSTVTAVGVTYVTVTGTVKFLRINITADTNVTLDVWITIGQQQPGAGLWISP